MRILISFAILTAAFTASAQTAAPFEWKGAIQPNQTLEIRNVTGAIKAEPASGSDVEISVQITGTYPDPNSIRIDVVQHDGGILVCTIYQGLSYRDQCTVGQTTSVQLSNSNIRVNYTVRVPADVNFVPGTVNGNISAELPDSPIAANTVNGRIVLSTNRPASANVVNGSILASLGNIDWTGSREFAAVKGSIDITVPEQARMTVHASTVWGYITNDFGLQVHRTLFANWFNGDINGGGSSLILVTVNGSIHLRQAADR